MTDTIYTADTCAETITVAQELTESFAQSLVRDVQRGRELVHYHTSLQSYLGYP